MTDPRQSSKQTGIVDDGPDPEQDRTKNKSPRQPAIGGQMNGGTQIPAERQANQTGGANSDRKTRQHCSVSLVDQLFCSRYGTGAALIDGKTHQEGAAHNKHKCREGLDHMAGLADGRLGLCLNRALPERSNTMSKESGTLPKQLVVAIIQQPPVFLNLPESIRLAAQLVSQAAASGADLVVFPETWLPGYPVWLDFAPGAALWGNPAAEALFAHLFAHSPAIDGPELALLAELALELKIDIVIGLHEQAGKSLYNSLVLLACDGTRGLHRKLMPTHAERLIWGQGDGSTLAAWPRPYGKLGGLICWEHWMPLARAAMHAQHETIHIAQWPAVGELHQLASRHYAFEGQCHVIAAGCVLTREDVLAGFDSAEGDPTARRLLEAIPEGPANLKDGGSAVIAPDGSYVLAPNYGDRSMRICTIDPRRNAHGSLYLDTHGHYARPDVFELTVNTRANPGVRFSSE
jgi:nitrilase